ncbi:hypothetical protein Hypma_008500 [Hypsizygus marmoreus]|uniref:DUF6534 domain-containing protein n=1 Tax=Hypsizygus marmoreus TaxID=39966 RepID=A0A369JSR5_HYPMA|nr:hypothetical protein Hypma_008500 [Hypsizygus marmoreus]
MVDIARNQGALLLGGFMAAGLSGIVAVQTILYLKLYPLDHPRLKCLVLLVWVLDLTHSGLTWASIWHYLVEDYGRAERVDTIPLTLSLTIVFTVSLSQTHLRTPSEEFLVGNTHVLSTLVGLLPQSFRLFDLYILWSFFAHRIFIMSKRNLYLTLPIDRIRLRSFTLFKAHFRWLFSLGLALSSIVDILVTLSLFTLLQNSRSRSLSLDHIIDLLILYTFEMGSLTCAGTIVSMICWLTMNDNLIFMGLHFVIGKLYANSLLAALNTRHDLRRAHSSHDIRPVVNLEGSRRSAVQLRNPFINSDIELQHVQINVEKSVTYVVGESGSISRA